MNGKLAAFYGISPATASTLGGIAGADIDPYSPEAWQAAIDASAASPAEKDAANRVNQAVATVSPAAGLAATNPLAADPNWTPEAEAERTAKFARDKELGAATPQGPAGDNFPSFKTDFGEGVAAGNALPVRTVPAHWQSTTHDITTERNMDPESLDGARFYRQNAQGQTLLAHDAREEAAAVQATMNAHQAYGEKMANDYYGALIERNRIERDQFRQSEMRKLDELATQANAKVDSEDLWKDKGDGAKVYAAIALGLGTFGASITGGPNTAFQIIQGAIDRNIRAQEANIASARGAYGLRANLLQQNVEAFGDKERGILATRIQYLDNVKQSIQQQLGSMKASAEQRAEASEFMAKFENERAQTEERFAHLTAVKSVEKSGEKYVPSTTVGGGGEKNKDPLYVPTLGGYARDEKTAQKLNEKGALRMQMAENMRQINGLMDEAKTKNSATSPLELAQLDREIQRLVNDTLTKNTVLEGQGAMSKDDKEVAAQAKGLSDLRVQFASNGMIERQQQRVRKAASGLLTAHRLEGEANGIQMGREVYRQGPSGPEPVRVLEGRNKTVSKTTESFDDLIQPPKGEVKKK